MASVVDRRSKVSIGMPAKREAAPEGSDPASGRSRDHWLRLSRPAGAFTAAHSAESPRCGVALLPRVEPEVLLAPWRMMMFGDASPTKLLGLLTGSPTAVEVLGTRHLASGDRDHAPDAIDLIREPRFRREVFLGNTAGERLGYAASWWASTDHDRHLADRSRPIGASLASKRTEVFREVIAVYRGSSTDLAAAFGVPEEQRATASFLARHYLFWHRGEPLALILEVFSPRLEAWMGPATAPVDS